MKLTVLKVRGDEIQKASDQDLLHDIGAFVDNSRYCLVQANRYLGEIERRRNAKESK